MVLSTLVKFLYPPPPSLYITAMTLISVALATNGCFMEIKGKHMQYSKFWNAGAQGSAEKKAKISSKTGMLVLYTPAFLAALLFFGLFLGEGFRFALVNAALTIHFLKRILEVLFVHKYSGSMDVEAATAISLSYFLATRNMIYAQYLTQGFSEPSIDLKYAGLVMFLIGISGNSYHHYLLSKLRIKGQKEYKIPKGGLFNLVICPHYLFEILGFMGVSCISQTIFAFSFTLGTILYLMGRSYATKKWYISKFEDFPKNVKSLIPYIF